MQLSPFRRRTSSKHKMDKTDKQSGCLMSIIVTLSSSSDFEQREKEKTRNEKAFSESNKKLGELITAHQKDINKIVDGFGAMTTSINDSRQKIQKIKHDLNSCKSLLHFKRDELRKLWRDGVEHKTVLSMFDQIEQIKEVPDKMAELEAQKYYLHATELVVNSVGRLEGPLSNVDALRDLRAELNARKERLHEIIIDELNRQIYEKSGLQNSLRRGSRTTLRDGSLKRSASGVNFGRDSPTFPGQDDSDVDLKDIREDLKTNPEENQLHFITVLVESLSELRKLPEAVEAVKMKIHPELLSLIAKASIQIVESAGEHLATQNEPRYLLELLEVVFQQFRNVASMHALVLRNVHRAMASGMPMRSDLMYDMKDVWLEFQAVLQILLGEYLDVKNTLSSRQQAPSGFDEPSMDIRMYFSKKRLPRPKRVCLFRFDASLHAMSTNSYHDSGRRFERTDMFGDKGPAGLSKHQLVCKPDANNITIIYKPLRSFIQEIEAAMETAPSLQEYITDFVENAFLGQVHQKVSQSIDTATRGFDALRSVITEKTRRELGIPRPLLQSTVTVDKNIEQLQGLMRDLPDYADQFLNMISNVLRDYRDKCNSAYRDIVQHGSDEKRVISALWAKDEDISRFLRSLPSWRWLHQAGTELNKAVCSEAELRVLSVKEVTILISNLSSDDSLIPQNEIITDITQMRTIANVHESLEWFANRLQLFANSLSARSSSGSALNIAPKPDPFVMSEIPPVSDKTLQSLRALVQDFRDLAEICLLLLHLEIRVHCFYYLLPVTKQSNYAGPIDDLDPDSNVLKLNKDLTGMEEVLSQSLQPKKFRYIFESLGYLVSSILITSIQFLKKINENGIKKMCRNILAIQQNLTNITLTREADLDRARQFYELLYLTPEDILNTIAEKGVQFSFMEYSQLLQLYHRSHTGISADTQKQHIERLRRIMDPSAKS